MRLFLAVKPDRPAEALLARRLLELQNAMGSTASLLRWVPATNIHVTLQFLGEIDASRLAHLHESLGPSIAEAPFDLELGALGAFPPAGAPRVVWLEIIKGLEPLERLHAELGRRSANAGVPLDSRPFSPHVTVARVPDRERASVAGLRAQMATVASTPIGWVARHVTLFRSDLSGAVPRYEGVSDIECLVE